MNLDLGNQLQLVCSLFFWNNSCRLCWISTLQKVLMHLSVILPAMLFTIVCLCVFFSTFDFVLFLETSLWRPEEEQPQRTSTNADAGGLPCRLLHLPPTFARTLQSICCHFCMCGELWRPRPQLRNPEDHTHLQKQKHNLKLDQNLSGSVARRFLLRRSSLLVTCSPSLLDFPLSIHKDGSCQSYLK